MMVLRVGQILCALEAFAHSSPSSDIEKGVPKLMLDAEALVKEQDHHVVSILPC